jgi:hypothetical protein
MYSCYEIPPFFGASFQKFFIAQINNKKSLSRRKKKFEMSLLFLLSAEISCCVGQKKSKYKPSDILEMH